MVIIDTLDLLLFTTLSSIAAVASLHALRTKQKYGLYRFLGFEALILLIVSNKDFWFQDPFSSRQILSWTIFIIATSIAVHGAILLRTVGRARNRVVENTQTIVEAGLYRYIRHPLYAALILFGWGVFLKNMSTDGFALATAATIFLYITARYEEDFNSDHFGNKYCEYKRRTKMFIPFVL